VPSPIPSRASCPSCKNEWEIVLEREDDFAANPVDPFRGSGRPAYIDKLVCPNCGQGGRLMSTIEASVADTADVTPDPSALLRDRAEDLAQRDAEDARQ
jgi:uncharacterized protein YbaR (Trm112 family)